MSAREAPLLLGHICSVWRTIALSTPRLWSSIHIAEPHPDLAPSFYDGCLRLVATWLRRSGALPLSISFHRPAFREESPFFDAIAAFSPRWKHISLSGQSRVMLSREDVPLLETIKISDYSVADNVAEAKRQDFLGGACVREVFLGTEIDPLQLPLPWSQLTTLTLARLNNAYARRARQLSSSAALRILANCHSLRECVLFLTHEPDELLDLPSSVEVPSLASLKLSLDVFAIPAHQNPLDRLQLPQLASFIVHGHHQPTIFPFLTLLSTAKTLKNIEIETLMFTAETLVAFLQRLPPSVQRLSMRQNVIDPETRSLVDNEILHLLAPSSPSESCLLPVLDTFTISYASSFSDDDLLRFIRVRMAIHPLRQVTVRFFRLEETKILPELKSIMDDFGLVVSLDYLTTSSTWNPHDGSVILFS
ncbi:hypothetical protein C8F04DRAFT_1153793 [Mycena alexandri]|uniref:F-box domain-containing protein n=1 Tax=Mycena alexandri TaxID=1745969 RepID=A0AAD6RYN2_9AGAR|nr:hypothetical protein C8F04DRAFT_1153793 [Mycena alexandri]